MTAAGAETELARLAEQLGAPVFHTANGKCSLPADHPLAAGMPWREASSDLTNMEEMFSPLFAQSDGLLAIGCRFTQLLTGTWSFRPPPLAQIDIDPEEIGRHYPVQVGIVGDARRTLQALREALPGTARRSLDDDSAARRAVAPGGTESP